MKFRLLLLFLSVLFIGQINSQNRVRFSDDFETVGFPTGYFVIDLDGNTVSPALSSVFTNAWNRLAFPNSSNYAILSTSSYVPTSTSNDWVITPAITTTLNNALYFRATSGSATSLDNYEVMISNTGPNLGNFVTLLTVTGESANGTNRIVDLSAYANQTIYIAFRNNTPNGYFLAIDDIEVKEVYNGDIALSSFSLSNFLIANQSTSLTGTIQNDGLDTIQSLDLNYRINGGSIQTQTISNLNILPNAAYNFNHSTPFIPANAGTNTTVEAWTSNPNGSPDTYTANDSLSETYFVILGNTVQKNVLFEEFTTAACQFCPDGHVIQDQIVAAIPSVIPVGVHACFSTDLMTTPDASQLCAILGNNSAPMAMVDRKLYEGNTTVAFGRQNSAWANACSTQTAMGSAVDITLSGTYNATTRLMDVDMDVNLVDYVVAGDIRVSLQLLEDSMSGVGPGWQQLNGYYGVLGHPFYGVGIPVNSSLSYIDNYNHMHVLRDAYPNIWGDASVVPNNYQLNTTYTRNFQYTMPTTLNDDNAFLVAVVSYFGGANKSEYIVLNAKKVKLKTIATGIEKSKLSNSIKIYPNPSNLPFTNIELSMSEKANVQASIMDVSGKVVHFEEYGQMAQGNQIIRLNTENLENGFYFVNLRVGNEELSRKIAIMR